MIASSYLAAAPTNSIPQERKMQSRFWEFLPARKEGGTLCAGAYCEQKQGWVMRRNTWSAARSGKRTPPAGAALTGGTGRITAFAAGQ